MWHTECLRLFEIWQIHCCQPTSIKVLKVEAAALFVSMFIGSRVFIWSNYSNLTQPHPKCSFSKGNLLFQANLGWWNIIIWPDLYNSKTSKYCRICLTSSKNCLHLDAFFWISWFRCSPLETLTFHLVELWFPLKMLLPVGLLSKNDPMLIWKTLHGVFPTQISLPSLNSIYDWVVATHLFLFSPWTLGKWSDSSSIFFKRVETTN